MGGRKGISRLQQSTKGGQYKTDCKCGGHQNTTELGGSGRFYPPPLVTQGDKLRLVP